MDLGFVFCCLCCCPELQTPGEYTLDDGIPSLERTKGSSIASPDKALYTRVFTGRAKQLHLCEHCSTNAHSSDQCASPPVRKRQRENTVWPMSSSNPISVLTTTTATAGSTLVGIATNVQSVLAGILRCRSEARSGGSTGETAGCK